MLAPSVAPSARELIQVAALTGGVQSATRLRKAGHRTSRFARRRRRRAVARDPRFSLRLRPNSTPSGLRTVAPRASAREVAIPRIQLAEFRAQRFEINPSAAHSMLSSTREGCLAQPMRLPDSKISIVGGALCTGCCYPWMRTRNGTLWTLRGRRRASGPVCGPAWCQCSAQGTERWVDARSTAY